MERQTWHNGEYWTQVQSRKIGYKSICAKLAAYEDTGLEPEEITTKPYGCVFYCNRRCNLDGDWCVEGPGCQKELTKEQVFKLRDELGKYRSIGPVEELRALKEAEEKRLSICCRDCKHARQSNIALEFDGQTPLYECNYMTEPNRGHEFCSFGER